MPKIHRGGWTSDQGVLLAQPGTADESGEQSSPGTSSSASPRKRRTKPNTNANESRPPAPTTDNP